MQAKTLSKSDRDLLWQRRWKARSDLLWLCRNVLGYTTVVDHVHGPMIENLQKFPLPSMEAARQADKCLDNGKWQYDPWCSPYELPNQGRRQLILAARGTYKTSLNTVAHTIQWLLNFPERTIVLIFSTDKKGQDTLKNEIKWHFQYNQKFRELFPDYCPQKRIADFGTAEEIILPNRDALIQRLQKKGGYKPPKEPSIMTLSIDKAGTGYHFDVMKCSDIVETTNIVTVMQRDQVKQRFGLLPSLLVHPTGWIDVEGTIYHPDDLHQKLIEDWLRKEPHERQWNIFIQPIIMRDTKGVKPRFDPLEMQLPWAKDVEGKAVPLWPERFPLALLEKLKNDPVEGGLTYACTPGYGKILMGDWSEKPIKDIEIGETVVGFGPYICPNGLQKQKLKPSIVLDKGSIKATVLELTMGSGRKLYCTEDHLWYTNRSTDKTHPSPFYPAKINRKIVKVYNPPQDVTDWEGDDPIMEIRTVGEDTVYWLKTETGNYVSQGYASKNSQRLLDLNAIEDEFLKPLQVPLSWVKRDAFRSVPIAYHVTTVDMADTTGAKSNSSCISTFALDRAGRTYLHDIRHGRFTPDELIRQIFEVYKLYSPQRITVEKTGFTQGLRPSIQRYEDVNHIYPNWDFRDAPRTTNKATRIINAVGPPLRSGELRIVEPLMGCDHDKITKILEDELRGVTPQSTGSSDDIIDTIAYYFLSREWLGREGLRRGSYDPLAQDRLVKEILEPEPMPESVHQEAFRKMIFSPEGNKDDIFDPFRRATGW